MAFVDSAHDPSGPAGHLPSFAGEEVTIVQDAAP
jgi:hypothetical protein